MTKIEKMELDLEELQNDPATDEDEIIELEMKLEEAKEEEAKEEEAKEGWFAIERDFMPY